MQVAAVTATLEGGPEDLRTEAAMVKGALLYADSVRIVSRRLAMLFVQAGEQKRSWDLLAECVGDDGSKFLAAVLERVRSHHPEGLATVERILGEAPTPAEIAEALHQADSRDDIQPGYYEAFVWNHLPQFVMLFAGLHRMDPEPLLAAVNDLKLAARAGLVDFDLLGAERTYEVGAHELAPEAMKHLISAIVTMAVEPGRLYPLFEDHAYSIARSLAYHVATPPIKDVGITQALIVSLESFPMASMDVVLDVRERLKPALGRFRSAMAQATREIDDVPADAGFAAAIEGLCVRTIEPALQDIREELDDLGARSTLLRGWPKVAAGTIGLAAAAAVKAPELAQLAPLLAGTSAAFTAELTERAKLKRGRERNQFFFLHAAEDYLSEGIDDVKRRR